MYVEEMSRQQAAGNELKCRLKEAQLLMSRQCLKRAKFLLKSNIDSFERMLKSSQEDDVQIEIYVKSLDLYAQLLSATQEISPHQIMNEYLEKSVAFAAQESQHANINSSEYTIRYI